MSATEVQPQPPQPQESQPEKEYARHEVASHNTPEDLWVIVDNVVYDLTKFQDDHPGGKKILYSVAGTDASKKYHKYHGPVVLKRYGAPIRIGTILASEVEKKPQSKGFFSRFKRK